jgi:hypothetical protein
MMVVTGTAITVVVLLEAAVEAKALLVAMDLVSRAATAALALITTG